MAFPSSFSVSFVSLVSFQISFPRVEVIFFLFWENKKKCFFALSRRPKRDPISSIFRWSSVLSWVVQSPPSHFTYDYALYVHRGTCVFPNLHIRLFPWCTSGLIMFIATITLQPYRNPNFQLSAIDAKVLMGWHLSVKSRAILSQATRHRRAVVVKLRTSWIIDRVSSLINFSDNTPAHRDGLWCSQWARQVRFLGFGALCLFSMTLVPTRHNYPSCFGMDIIIPGVEEGFVFYTFTNNANCGEQFCVY